MFKFKYWKLEGVKYIQVNKNTPQQRHWRRSGVFIVNFDNIFLLLTLSR